MRPDFNLLATEGHGAAVVGLQQDADRVERQLQFRTESNEDAANLWMS